MTYFCLLRLSPFDKKLIRISVDHAILSWLNGWLQTIYHTKGVKGDTHTIHGLFINEQIVHMEALRDKYVERDLILWNRYHVWRLRISCYNNIELLL